MGSPKTVQKIQEFFFEGCAAFKLSLGVGEETSQPFVSFPLIYVIFNFVSPTHPARGKKKEGV